MICDCFGLPLHRVVSLHRLLFPPPTSQGTSLCPLHWHKCWHFPLIWFGTQQFCNYRFNKQIWLPDVGFSNSIGGAVTKITDEKLFSVTLGKGGTIKLISRYALSGVQTSSQQKTTQNIVQWYVCSTKLSCYFVEWFSLLINRLFRRAEFFFMPVKVTGLSHSRLTVDLSCDMDFKYYPMDTQICEVQLQSCEFKCNHYLFFSHHGYTSIFRDVGTHQPVIHVCSA